MDKIGVSFKSPLSRELIRDNYIRPLRAAFEQSGLGIYSNYLRQADEGTSEVAEHLLLFEVNDFKAGMHLLRMELEKLGPGEAMMLHNLNPSTPAY